MPGPRKNLTPLDMKMMGLAFNQGGIINFLGQQPEVTAPVRAQSHADSPPVQLAYITDAEKDLLVKSNIHGSMDGKPNPGPAGLPSLDDFFNIPGGGVGGGNVDTGQSYQSQSDYGIGAGQAVGGGDGGTGGQVFTQQSDGSYQQDNQATESAAQTAQNLQEKIAVEAAKKKAEEAKVLAQTGADEAETLTDTLLGRIKTKIMGGGEGGDSSLTKEKAYADLPAGMHPLRKQYEYLSKKYGPAWQKTTQAKVLEGYLSGVPVERGGGLGARDDTYGGGEKPQVDQFGNPIDPEQFGVAEKLRQQLLSNMGMAGSDIGGMNTMGSVGDQLEALKTTGSQFGFDSAFDDLRYGLSPEQYFNFNQQLMAADPSAENQAYKDARPFSSGAGLSTLFEKFAPLPLKAIAGMFPERDLSGFENYADYEQAGAGFRPLLPVPEQNNQGVPIRRPGPMIPLPDPSQPVDPTYPFPVKPPNGSKFPFPVGITSAFDPRFIGPSFRGSQYTNRGVSPAFYEALRRFS